MTATSCNVALTGRRIRVELPNKHTYVAQFQIVTDDRNDSMLTVLDSAQLVGPTPLPRPGDDYSFLGDYDANSQVRDIDLVQSERDNQVYWLATVTWRPGESGEPTQDDVDTPPTERPVRYWVEYNRVTETVVKDGAGEPVVNKANQPYPEPIVRTRHDPVLVITRYYATIDEIWDLNESYQNTVNSDVFLQKAAGKWRYAMTRANEPEEIDGSLYYHGVTRIEFKKEGWKVTKREEGWKVLEVGTVPSQDKLVTPTQDGLPMGEPVLLDFDGRWLDDISIDPIDTEWELDVPTAYAPLIA